MEWWSWAGLCYEGWTQWQSCPTGWPAETVGDCGKKVRDAEAGMQMLFPIGKKKDVERETGFNERARMR